jgi:hypothetical protein
MKRKTLLSPPAALAFDNKAGAASAIAPAPIAKRRRVTP